MARSKKSFWSRILTAGKKALLGDYSKDRRTYRRYAGSSGMTKSRNLGYDDTITNVKHGRRSGRYAKSSMPLKERKTPMINKMQKNRYDRKYDEGVTIRKKTGKYSGGLLGSLVSAAGKLSKMALPLVEGGLAIHHQRMGQLREQRRWEKEDERRYEREKWAREDERERRRWAREDRRRSRYDDDEDKEEALKVLATLKGNAIKGEDEETMKYYSPADRMLATEMPTKPRMKRKRARPMLPAKRRNVKVDEDRANALLDKLLADYN